MYQELFITMYQIPFPDEFGSFLRRNKDFDVCYYLNSLTL